MEQVWLELEVPEVMMEEVWWVVGVVVLWLWVVVVEVWWVEVFSLLKEQLALLEEDLDLSVPVVLVDFQEH